MQNFLELWTQYNVLIINWLIITVVVLILLVVFFAALRPQSLPQSGASISADLENTLKKLIEQQGPRSSSPASEASGAEGGGGASSSNPSEAQGDGATMDSAQPASSSSVEVGASDSIAESTAPGVAASTEASAGGDGNQLKERIKELEARLTEYEIIAEDIADLSFYKEENQKLQKEIDEIKKKGSVGAPSATSSPPASAESGGGAGPEPSAAAGSPVPPLAAPTPSPSEMASASSPPGPSPAAPTPPTPTTTPTPAPTASSGAAPDQSVEAAANPDLSEVANAPVDEDLLKAFDDVVSSQEPAALNSAPKNDVPQEENPPDSEAEAASAPEATPPTDDNAELLNKFEDFVKKS